MGMKTWTHPLHCFFFFHLLSFQPFVYKPSYYHHMELQHPFGLAMWFIHGFFPTKQSDYLSLFCSSLWRWKFFHPPQRNEKPQIAQPLVPHWKLSFLFPSGKLWKLKPAKIHLLWGGNISWLPLRSRGALWVCVTANCSQHSLCCCALWAYIRAGCSHQMGQMLLLSTFCEWRICTALMYAERWRKATVVQQHFCPLLPGIMHPCIQSIGCLGLPMLSTLLEQESYRVLGWGTGIVSELHQNCTGLACVKIHPLYPQIHVLPSLVWLSRSDTGMSCRLEGFCHLAVGCDGLLAIGGLAGDPFYYISGPTNPHWGHVFLSPMVFILKIFALPACK